VARPGQTCEIVTIGALRERRPSHSGETTIPATEKQQPTPGKAVSALSFEAALKELETIVSRLEQGEVDLEDSIALYERGQALKTHCETKLKAAEGRLEKIVLGAGGPVTETLDMV
jgi:exodeoxyribonuclease VII small subunit